MMQAVQATQPEAAVTPIDSEMLARVGGDRELLAEVIEMFLEDAPMQIDVMRRGLIDGDSAVVRSAAHSMAGCAGNFGATEVTVAARRLEAAAQAEDVAASQQAFPPLENAVLQMLERLVAIQTALTCAS